MNLRRLAALTVALAISSSLAASAAADQTCDRTCRIDAANAYLAALVSHDGSQVPLHPDAWRQENGGQKLEGGESIHAALAHPIMYVITGIHDLRWYVDGDEAMAVYYLDTVAPTYIFERFKVDDLGLITEIDAHFYIDAPGHFVGPESIGQRPQGRVDALAHANHGPLGPVPVQAGNAGDVGPRAAASCNIPDVATCSTAVVNGFLDAMATGNLATAHLASGATQTINHRMIADPGAQLVAGAPRIATVDDRIFQVDGDQVTALYEIELNGGGRYYGAARFSVAGSTITDIEAVCDGAELCS